MAGYRIRRAAVADIPAIDEALGWSPDGHERHRALRGADVHEVRYENHLGRRTRGRSPG